MGVLVWMIKLTFADGTIREYPNGITLQALSNEFAGQYQSLIVGAKVNNKVRDLCTSLDEDCHVEFLDLYTVDGIRFYQRSLSFLLVRAVNELYPESKVIIKHSLSKGFYCEIERERPLSQADVLAIEQKMRELVALDVPFTKQLLPRETAIKLFASQGHDDKVRLLKHRAQNTVTVYECGNLTDYFYGYLVPSAGYLRVFELKYYPPGFILRFPLSDNPHELPAFVEQAKMAQTFEEHKNWAAILGVSDVGSLNDVVAAGGTMELINVAEALHEKKIAQIADQIAAGLGQIGLVLIAGPSSSGKTTFIQRLAVQLRVNGVRSLLISLDDYFVNREQTPRDADGNYDFESIEAIDLDLFNEHLAALLHGEEVQVPIYNFVKGCRDAKTRTMRMESDHLILVEGIHGLNERLTASIPRKNKFKIYVSALTQLNIDDHNRLPTTDLRILRRIVRDNQFRGISGLETIRRWPSVRRGEERNIFPFQEEADVMFNSALVYELAVLKRFAEPILQTIKPTEPEYAEALRLLKFLSYFLPIDSDYIPFNSIIREFIGNSCFY